MGGEFITALIVAPHPDDETIGAAIWMHRRPKDRLHVLHITGGSPRDSHDARARGFTTREAYAEARRAELDQALTLIGIPERNRAHLDCVDKEAYLNLPRIIDGLEAMVDAIKPVCVLSPAYEGGHPDHDATALAVATVRRKRGGFQHWEYALYHADASGQMSTGGFLPGQNSEEEVLNLSEPERVLKCELRACFQTQLEILSHFQLCQERFRPAPSYDFSKPPHPGRLLYETWGWEITGADWRRRAARQITSLYTTRPDASTSA